MPRLPAGPCSLQSRCDNKTNNFLALLSWTPFIFPQPQGRTDLMVGPKCGSCTVTGGWARPARQGWATPAPSCFSRPAASPPFSCPITLYCLPFPSSIFPLRSQSGCFSFHWGLFFPLSSFLPGSHPSPSLFLSLSLSPGSPLSLSFFLPPSLAHSSLPVIPTLPSPLLAASLGPLSFCVPPPWTSGCAGQTQVVLFPGICCPVAAREGAAGWPGWEGGALLGSPSC